MVNITQALRLQTCVYRIHSDSWKVLICCVCQFNLDGDFVNDFGSLVKFTDLLSKLQRKEKTFSTSSILYTGRSIDFHLSSPFIKSSTSEIKEIQSDKVELCFSMCVRILFPHHQDMVSTLCFL